MKLTGWAQILTLFIYCNIQCQSDPVWQYVGPKEMKEQVKGFVRSVWVDEQNPDFMLAGSCSGGLFLTTNALAEKPFWKNISDSYSGMVMGVSGIVVKPNTQNKSIYISTIHNSGIAKGYGHGILKTTNGGSSWQQIGPKGETNFFMLQGLVSNRENSSEMIAYSDKELFITKDDWNTYEKIELPIDKNKEEAYCDVDFAPFEPGKFYVSTKTNNYYEPKLFICELYGRVHKNITPVDVKAERIEVAVVNDKKYTGRFYIALGTTNVFVKYFNGKSFTTLNDAPVIHTFNSAGMNLELAVNSVDTNIIYLCMTETSRSKDGGKTFEKIAVYNAHNTHADNRAIQLVKSSPGGTKDFFVMANDGGITLGDKFEPVQWKNLNGSGLNIHQFWGIDVAQSDSLFLAGGAQDNGGFLIGQNNVVNTMYSCGDGYTGLVLDNQSAIIQCNAPSMFYHNINTNQNVYLGISDSYYEGRRPMQLRDSIVYFGYHDIWRINRNNLNKGNFQFEKFTSIPLIKSEDGGTRNTSIKSMSLGNLNSGIICYSNPNWSLKENTGKVFFCSDLKAIIPEWKDITSLIVYNTVEINRWYEINASEMSFSNPDKFLLVSRDPFNQANNMVLELTYNSDKIMARKLNANLPVIGVNKIKTDKFSGITYLACDDGVYYSNLNTDSVTWNKLNGMTLPQAPVSDITFNYFSNTLVAATYGRGVWQTQLVTGKELEKIISKNTVENEATKINGRLIVNAKKNYTINSKLIIQKGSVIELRRGSSLIIKDKNLVRDENNRIIDLTPYIKRNKTAKVIYR